MTNSAAQAALTASRAQLNHWQDERAVAFAGGSSSRITQCERFIAQCEVVVAALEDAVKRDL